MTRWIVISLLMVLAGGSSLGAESGVEVLQRFELPPTSLRSLGRQPCNENDFARARTNGLKYDDLPSLGSGLACLGENEFVGISDRGPNGEVGKRRTFPLPKFAPYLTRFKLNAGKIEIVNSVVLTDTKGKPLTGLSNQQPEERLFETADASMPLPYDPSGIDPEAVRVFPDGKYLLSEEYGPSVLVVNTNGQVLIRYVPGNKFRPGAMDSMYPVKAVLPPVLSLRRTNRGFEALALSPDGRTAYAVLQSPLVDERVFESAQVSRVIRLDLSDPLNARVTGHFLLPLSRATDYSDKLKQPAVKLNDAEWLAPDKLLVLEQAGEVARLLVADFSDAGDLKNAPLENSTVPEAAGDDFTKLPVKPAVVEVWATISGLTKEPTKLEGLAVISPTQIALANDNDFGLGEGAAPPPSSVWLLRLSRPLPLVR
ncbi:MAG: esterase-like activity of phytase family protein [Verrucomicrobiota bacterium]